MTSAGHRGPRTVGGRSRRNPDTQRHALRELREAAVPETRWRRLQARFACAPAPRPVKRYIAARCRPDPAALPYRTDLIDIVRAEKARGRTIHLVTAADQSIADDVAAHFGLFDSASGSDGVRNLKGGASSTICAPSFPDGFIYAGDSSADLPVFRAARGVILCDVGRHDRSRGRRGKSAGARDPSPVGNVPRRPGARVTHPSMGQEHPVVRAAVRRSRIRRSEGHRCHRRSASSCSACSPRQPTSSTISPTSTPIARTRPSGCARSRAAA